MESADIPVEFQSTVDSFSQLVDRLSAMQEEKEEMYREKQRRYLETICGRAELAAGLLDSLFAYVRMEHPGYRPDKKKVDLGELVKEILAERYSEVENSGFHLEVNIPETPIPFSVDVRLFRRLLENLLGNTLKYNPAGTTFYVSLEETREQVILVVADDGVGIPPSMGRRVFDPFVTGSSARTTGEGTGLGLSIVKKLWSSTAALSAWLRRRKRRSTPSSGWCGTGRAHKWQAYSCWFMPVEKRIGNGIVKEK